MTPASAAIDVSTRRLAIVDFELREVMVLGLDGDWHGRWGRRGEGPGELSAPAAVAWREGGSLAVYDPGNGRIVVFDSSGAPTRDEPVEPAFGGALGGGVAWLAMSPQGTLLAQPIPRQFGDAAARDVIIVRNAHGSTRVDTVLSVSVPIVQPRGWMPVLAPGWARPVAALAGDSLLAVAGYTPGYRIRIYRNGAAAVELRRAADPRPLTADERQAEPRAELTEVNRLLATAPAPERPASVGRLMFDADARLWVHRDRPRPLDPLDGILGRAGGVLDVYASNGEYLGEVQLPAQARLLAATAALLVCVESSESGELSVVAYEMTDSR